MKKISLPRRWQHEFWEAIRDDSLAFLKETAKASEGYDPLVDQVYRSLIDYVLRGRGLTSSFILATYRGFGGTAWQDFVRVATAFELLSKSVLIIDDIVDDDTVRFGSDSFNREFEKYALDRDWAKPRRFGSSSGIFAGQLLATAAYRALSSANISGRKLKQLLALFLDGWKSLDESQLADLAFEQLFPTRAEWLQMAARRAASHVSISLRVGSALTGRSASAASLMARAGAELGYMYDIRSDLLDSFGKPIRTNIRGRDLRMKKKSLFMCIALTEAPTTDRKALSRLFSAPGTPSRRILQLAGRWGVNPALEELAKHKTQASRLIQASRLSPAGKEFFQDMVDRAGRTPALELTGLGQLA